MKKLLAILLILPFLSCSTEVEKNVDPEITGEWILTETSGQFPGSDDTGDEMPFQETYYLDEDGTFLKTRFVEGEEMEAQGTYELSETGSTIHGEEVIIFVQFEHESINPIIANCTSTLTEDLYLTSDRKLKSTYEACDGLGLQYQKME